MPILSFTLVGLAIQTGFEELYFQGLVAQATRRITKWIPVVTGVQAWWFASLYVGNVRAWGDGAMASLPYVVPELTWGWVGPHVGSLLMPMGLHFANDTVLVPFFNTPGDMLASAAPGYPTPVSGPRTEARRCPHARSQEGLRASRGKSTALEFHVYARSEESRIGAFLFSTPTDYSIK